MKIWEIDKLLLFLIFFIPGFISMKVYDLIVPIELRDFSKSVFEATGYSSINFALLSWLIALAHTEGVFLSRGGWYLLSLFVILFVFPILWPVLFIRISQWRLIANWIICTGSLLLCVSNSRTVRGSAKICVIFPMAARHPLVLFASDTT